MAKNKRKLRNGFTVFKGQRGRHNEEQRKMDGE